MALTPSIADSRVWMVHFVFSGNQNQSHLGVITAAAAGAEGETGGQTGPGAKSAVAADQEEDIDSCYIHHNTRTHFKADLSVQTLQKIMGQ